ncbi:MAG: 5-(carboxyamino)imidazole ribonucleotide mutase [Endomicrobiales bacterium]|nr:5-(carboxyamino)imidazole ribonucleotide mutase [Endomicrobiales bacterium]
MGKIKVAVLVGSDSDLAMAQETVKVLEELGIEHTLNVASAHRTPEKVKKIVKDSEANGAEVFIAGAGMSAALPGVVAAETIKPVIGIPFEGKAFGGLDALLSVIQMPPGIPVGSVAVGKAGALNAAIYAALILAVKHPEIRKKVEVYRKKLSASVEQKDKKLQDIGIKKYIEENRR